MTRHAYTLRILACGLILGLAAAAAQAATASGKLVHANGSPAAGISVTLANDQGRSAPAWSDSNGSYTISNIPAGRYYLQVWTNPRTPQTVEVTVTEPSTSLPQVTVP